MINTVKMELNKALLNRLFWIAIFIGCCITLISSITIIGNYGETTDFMNGIETKLGVKYNPLLDATTPFTTWIGIASHTQSAAIFYFIFSLLIAIPYGWSYCVEKTSGYERNVVLRSGKTNYYFAKYIAMFVSGGLVVLIPLLFNFLVMSFFLPLVPPDVSNDVYTGITPENFMSMLYYSKPYLYVFNMCSLNFLYGGLITCLCFACSVFNKNRVIVMLAPFVLLISYQYFEKFFLYRFVSPTFSELNPLTFLQGQMSRITLPVLIIETIFFILITSGVIVARGKKHEIL